MKDIYTFKFWKHKYGPELLVDIVDYAVMLPPIRRHPTFTETFYSVTIVLEMPTKPSRWTELPVISDMAP